MNKIELRDLYREDTNDINFTIAKYAEWLEHLITEKETVFEFCMAKEKERLTEAESVIQWYGDMTNCVYKKAMRSKACIYKSDICADKGQKAREYIKKHIRSE